MYCTSTVHYCSLVERNRTVQVQYSTRTGTTAASCSSRAPDSPLHGVESRQRAEHAGRHVGEHLRGHVGALGARRAREPFERVRRADAVRLGGVGRVAVLAAALGDALAAGVGAHHQVAAAAERLELPAAPDGDAVGAHVVPRVRVAGVHQQLLAALSLQVAQRHSLRLSQSQCSRLDESINMSTLYDKLINRPSCRVRWKINIET